MSKDIIIVGSGAFAREVFCLIKQINSSNKSEWNIRGFVSESEPKIELVEQLGSRYLGGLDTIQSSKRIEETIHFVVAVGDGYHRKRLSDLCITLGLTPTVLIHPNVVIGENVEIEEGVVICANSVITTNIKLRRGSQLNLNSLVGHDVELGNFVTLAPAVKIMGNSKVEEMATIYTGAIVAPSVNIGSNSIIGAGSVVLSDVPVNSKAFGNPAKVMGLTTVI